MKPAAQAESVLESGSSDFRATEAPTAKKESLQRGREESTLSTGALRGLFSLNLLHYNNANSVARLQIEKSSNYRSTNF